MSGKTDRPSKRVRKLSTDSEGTEEGVYDWAGRSGQSGRAGAKPSKNEMTRPRRTVSEKVATATVSRGPPSEKSRSPESMRLTVKTSSNKLREATRATPSPGSTIAVNSRDSFLGGEIVSGKRSRNVKKSYVVESESESEASVSDFGGNGSSEAEGGIDVDAMDEDDEESTAPPPPPPVIKVSKAASGRSTIVAKLPTKVDHKAVEQKEMHPGSDDEELSDLDSDIEDVEEEDGMQVDGDEDAEGEDDDMEVDEEIEAEEDAEEDELDSDDETPGDGSRASTPDLTKLTKRQRARLEEGGSGHLMALPDEVQVKKHLTAEEHAMRRAEMARRRKNLSEKRNEEEKMETINKLLKKQAPKTNARRSVLQPTGGEGTPESEQKADPIFVRWVSNKDGLRIGVPEEWLDGPIGSVFQGGIKQSGGGTGGKLIQEVS
ncbi:PAPA-1-like conserved region-domain-containing protein [Bisporella sp. PMI_857]|nr:PAPA-1-like conserved region-domain-containing protein [Bisporella sp. PMI_857]